MQLTESSKTLAITSLAHFINDGSLYVFITLYPKLLPSQFLLIGILGGLQNLFSVIASPFIGRIADRDKNYGRLMSLGLVLMGIGIVGYSDSVIFAEGSDRFLFLIPFAIIAGIGSSFYHPLGASTLHEKMDKQSMGRAMGINGAIGSLGRAVYPLFVVTLVLYFTVPSVALLSLVTFAAASIISSVFHGMQVARESIGSGVVASRKPQSAVPIKRLLPPILGLTVIAFAKGMFSIGIVYFMPSYLTNELHVGYNLEFGAMLSIMLVMAVVGQPLFGSVSDKLGRRLTLGISVAGSAASMLLFLGTTDILYSTIYLAMFGFFGLTGFPLLMPIAIDAAPEGAATMSGSIVWGVGNVGGGALGPFLIGLLANPGLLGSLASSFYVVTFISLISLVLFPTIPRPQKR